MIQIPGEIAEDYNRYYRYMQENLQFQMKGSSVHTQEHAARVLLYVLLLAKREGLTPEDAELLAAFDGYLLIGNDERAAAFGSEHAHLVAVHFDMYHTMWGWNVAFYPVEVA